MVLAYGILSFVIRPSRVVPKSIERQGFLKSIPAHFAPSFIPAVASSPSISLATISRPEAPIGGSTPPTAPLKTIFSIRLNFLKRVVTLSIDIAGIILTGGTPAIIQPSARAFTKCPTSSDESKPATTPVERTTK